MIGILETIAAGVTIISGIASLFRQASSRSEQSGEALVEVGRVEQRLRRVEEHLQGSTSNIEAASRSYESLLRALRASRYFSDRVELIPTEYGIWRVRALRSRRRKSTTLRDSHGEFSLRI